MSGFCEVGLSDLDNTVVAHVYLLNGQQLDYKRQKWHAVCT